MNCNHYPIVSKWERVKIDSDFVTWKCPNCGMEKDIATYKGGEIQDIISTTYEKRLEAARPLVQPFRNGVPSAEYVALTGGKNMSKEDQKRAVPVWGDVPGLKGVCNRADNVIRKSK